MSSRGSSVELSSTQPAEDLESQYGTYAGDAGEFTEDEQWTQYLDAPTPAFYVDSQADEYLFGRSSTALSVSPTKRLAFVP